MSYTKMRRIRAILQKLAIESLQMFLANFRCAFHQHLEVAGCSFLTGCSRNVQLGKQAASLKRSSSPAIDILKLVALVLEMQHKTKKQNFTTCNFSRHCLWLPPARQAQHQGPAMGCCAQAKGTRRAMHSSSCLRCIWTQHGSLGPGT